MIAYPLEYYPLLTSDAASCHEARCVDRKGKSKPQDYFSMPFECELDLHFDDLESVYLFILHTCFHSSLIT